jgi:hypothetical protein
MGDEMLVDFPVNGGATVPQGRTTSAYTEATKTRGDRKRTKRQRQSRSRFGAPTPRASRRAAAADAPIWQRLRGTRPRTQPAGTDRGALDRHSFASRPPQGGRSAR